MFDRMLGLFISSLMLFSAFTLLTIVQDSNANKANLEASCLYRRLAEK